MKRAIRRYGAPAGCLAGGIITGLATSSPDAAGCTAALLYILCAAAQAITQKPEPDAAPMHRRFRAWVAVKRYAPVIKDGQMDIDEQRAFNGIACGYRKTADEPVRRQP